MKRGSSHQIKPIQKWFISTTKKSKQLYFTRFFQGNIKNMLKRIKKITSSNNSNYNVLTVIAVNNKTINNSSATTNAFNNYFAKIALHR